MKQVPYIKRTSNKGKTAVRQTRKNQNSSSCVGVYDIVYILLQLRNLHLYFRELRMKHSASEDNSEDTNCYPSIICNLLNRKSVFYINSLYTQGK